jgi:hypothetical protein
LGLGRPIADYHAPAVFLEIPSCAWIVSICHHQLNLGRSAVKEHAITLAYLFARSVTQSQFRRRSFRPLLLVCFSEGYEVFYAPEPICEARRAVRSVR